MAASVSLIRRVGESGLPLLLVRLFLGLYFLRTGIVKAIDPVEFLKVVRTYGLLPESPPVYLNATAIVLPWLEIMCGLALVLGIWLRGAALQVAAMLLAFTPAIALRAMAVMRADPQLSFFDVQFNCGCGTGDEVIWVKLLKNTGLTLLALIVLFSRSRRFCLANLLERCESGQTPGDRHCDRPVAGSPDDLSDWVTRPRQAGVLHARVKPDVARDRVG